MEDTLVLPRLLQAPSGRVAVVAAHPDDETIGAGGVLPLLGDAVVLVVTDGAPRGSGDIAAAGCASAAEYAALRRRELAAAMALAGIPEERLESFAVPDQGASSDMAGLAHRLADWLHARGIGLVLTHPFEMGHPDHDAVALAVHAAAALMARNGRAAPRLVEFPSYHRSASGAFVCGVFAPGGQEGETVVLDRRAQARKRLMIEAHRSQSRTLAPFGVEAERFRAAPACTFTAPPHGGGAYYDMFQWGMRSESWLALAAEALVSLRLGPC